MLRLGRERSTLRVVADQIGGPTPASAIADALISCSRSLLEGVPGGTHHFAGSPDVSWAEFARAIFRAAGLDCSVEDIGSADYPQPAERPRNSRLDCRLFTEQFGVDRPDWRVSLAEVIRELGVK
jgi:dTDP-4-dehydrorhamnose reductase